MNIQIEKLEILKMILETDNLSIIESIKRIFNPSSNADFWETFSYDQKEDILKGLKETENRNIINHSMQ